jgi:hypothetical protein
MARRSAKRVELYGRHYNTRVRSASRTQRAKRILVLIALWVVWFVIALSH